MADARDLATVQLATDLLADASALVAEYRSIKDAIAASQAAISTALKGMGVTHRWVGNRLDLLSPDGTWATGADLKGAKGDKGDQGDTGPSIVLRVNAGVLEASPADTPLWAPIYDLNSILTTSQAASDAAVAARNAAQASAASAASSATGASVSAAAAAASALDTGSAVAAALEAVDEVEATIAELATAMLAAGSATVVHSVGELPAGTTVALGFVISGDSAGIWSRNTSGVWSNTGLAVSSSVSAQVAANAAAIALRVAYSAGQYRVKGAPAVTIATPDGQILANISGTGVWDMVLKSLRSADGVKVYNYETRMTGVGYVVGAGGAIAAELGGGDAILAEEIVAARGERAALADRLGVLLDPFGAPLSAHINPGRIRQARGLLAGLKAAGSGQVRIALIGDSWMDSADSWTINATKLLKSEFGDAGLGFIKAWGLLPTPDTNYSVARTGSWVNKASETAGNPASICGSLAVSSTPGDRITFTGKAGGSGAAEISGGAVLHWTGTADGVIRYRTTSAGVVGAWTEITVQGAGLLGTTALTPPTYTGAWSLDVEVVSGTAQIAGLSGKGATSAGVLIQNIAKFGSQSNNWNAWMTAEWVTAFAALAPHLVILSLGTNDANQGILGSTLATNLAAMVAKIHTASPGCDILFVCPTRNGIADHAFIDSYRNAYRKMAITGEYSMVDLQRLFGATYTDYSSTAALPLFKVDGAHPNTLGYNVIAADIVSLIKTGA